MYVYTVAGLVSECEWCAGIREELCVVLCVHLSGVWQEWRGWILSQGGVPVEWILEESMDPQIPNVVLDSSGGCCPVRNPRSYHDRNKG